MTGHRSTADDIRDALRDLLGELRDTSLSAVKELAETLEPARNVRVVPSDDISFQQTTVPAGPAVQLVAASDQRVRVTIHATDIVFLGGRQGSQYTDTDMFQLPAATGVPLGLVLETKAAIYATGGLNPARVQLVIEQADYS